MVKWNCCVFYRVVIVNQRFEIELDCNCLCHILLHIPASCLAEILAVVLLVENMSCLTAYILWAFYLGSWMESRTTMEQISCLTALTLHPACLAGVDTGNGNVVLLVWERGVLFELCRLDILTTLLLFYTGDIIHTRSHDRFWLKS